MRAIDTHAHLDFPEFDTDRDELISNLQSQDIGVICVATTEESNKKVKEIAAKHPLVWSTVGIHPSDINNQTLLNLPTIIEGWKEELKTDKKIVALGEVGLDYFRTADNNTASMQKSALRQLLTFALEERLPVSFHCRDAYGDLITMLGDYPGLKGVIHCFAGSQEQAYEFLELGLHISFTGMLGYPKNDHLRQIAKNMPEDRLLLETDSPFLPVQDKRGTRNDPTAVMNIAEELALLRGIPTEDILNATIENSLKVFSRMVEA